MRPTATLWQHALRLTLFTRPNCSLCVEAKTVLSKVWDERHFEYDEIDVMTPGQGRWKELYEFDTPVVHFDRNDSTTTAQSRKLMHRMSEADVQVAMDEVERK